jgi:hypothetical protein
MPSGESPPGAPPDRYRASLSILEEEKRTGRIDEIISRDLNLLLEGNATTEANEEAIKANVRTTLNAKIASRLITGRA